jgi:hypothetical protein
MVNKAMEMLNYVHCLSIDRSNQMFFTIDIYITWNYT